QAVAVVEEPAEMAMPTVAIERPLGSWTEPHVVVSAFRWLAAVGWIADVVRPGTVRDPGSAEGNVPQLARLDIMHCVLEMLPAALLRTDLYHTFVLPSGVDHGPAFDDVV